MATSPDQSRDAPRPESERPLSGQGRERGVTIHVTNSIQAPNIDFKVTVPYVLGSPLLFYLERAAEKDPRFRFNASYFGRELGYSVNVLPELKIDTSAGNTYWKLASADGPLQLGPSNYVPEDGETIQFSLTRSTACPSTSSSNRRYGVTLRLINTTQDPHFDFDLTLPYVKGSSVQAYLETAGEEDERFRFIVTYYGRELGYFLNAINDLQADYENDRTFWRIVDSAGTALPVGISNYVPRDGETIQFIFTRSEECPGTETSTKRYGVTLRLINTIQDPHFDFDLTLPYVKGSSVQAYLETAAEEDERFRCSVSFRGKSYGYHLDGVNGLRGDYDLEQSWWRLDYSGTPGPTVGISHYVPEDGETIQFIFTKGPRSDDNFRPRPGVTLRVINSVQDPTCDFLTVQPYRAGATLRSYLESAAEETRRFRFTAKYDGPTQQYVLTGINKLRADHVTSWRLADSDGTALPEDTSLSHYVPRDGETIQFIFTRSEAN